MERKAWSEQTERAPQRQENPPQRTRGSQTLAETPLAHARSYQRSNTQIIQIALQFRALIFRVAASASEWLYQRPVCFRLCHCRPARWAGNSATVRAYSGQPGLQSRNQRTFVLSVHSLALAMPDEHRSNCLHSSHSAYSSLGVSACICCERGRLRVVSGEFCGVPSSGAGHSRHECADRASEFSRGACPVGIHSLPFES